MDDINSESRELAISVPPPLDSGAEYCSPKTISLNITNLTASPVLLEDITLRFQPDSGSVDVYEDQKLGIRIPAHELAVISVEIIPTVLYQEATNYFGVLIHYCPEVDGRPGVRKTARHENASYLIIKRPKDVLAEVFISFKQPEYLTWTRLLDRYARRAGFSPYFLMQDPQPGTDQWNRIEEAIKRSKAVFVIWGNRTEWGTGVQREVELCRKHGVQEILLLDWNLDTPEMFKGTSIEYSRFDPDSPNDSFAKAVDATRRRFLMPKG